MYYLIYTFRKKTFKDTKKIQFEGKAICILENIKKTTATIWVIAAVREYFKKQNSTKKIIVL